MYTSTLTKKGQTTIPVDVQKFLNVHAGDKLQYFVEGDKIVIMPKSLSVSDLKGVLPKPKKVVSIEEMNTAIGQATSERNHK